MRTPTEATIETFEAVALVSGRSELIDNGPADPPPPPHPDPFVTATRFHDTLRAGAMRAGGRDFEPDSAERVADVILDLVRTGAEEAVLVPAGLRGGA